MQVGHERAAQRLGDPGHALLERHPPWRWDRRSIEHTEVKQHLPDGLDSAASVPPATTGAVLASAARRGELLQVGGRPQIGAGAGRASRAVRVQNVIIDLGAVAFVWHRSCCWLLVGCFVAGGCPRPWVCPGLCRS